MIMDDYLISDSVSTDIFSDLTTPITTENPNPTISMENTIDDILDLENISLSNIISTDNNVYDESDLGSRRHLELIDENSKYDTEFKTYIKSPLAHPHILIKKDSFVKAQLKNLFSLVTKGDISLMLECGDKIEEIYKIDLTTSNLINLKRIFSTDIIYVLSDTERKLLQPLDLLVTEDIF